MMLRGNLATRPFYNERLVTLAIVVVTVIVVALTIFNATQLVSLSSRRSALRAEIAADETQAAQIRANATAVQNSVDRAALQDLAGSTRLANNLITARTFSWTTFFGYIEDTIPFDVRITAVSPEIEKGEIIVSMLLLGRSESDIEAFAAALEGTGAFYDVGLTVADTTEDRLKRVTLTSKYAPPRIETPAVAPVSPQPEQPKKEGGRP
jgi:hypothetical protein